MQDILAVYTEEIKKSFDDQLKSIVLYGSKANGDGAGTNSDLNLLVLVENSVTEQLALLAPATKKWIKAGNPPPVIFTAAQIATSADVFPIEFLDMKEGSRLLYGEDLLSSLKVSDAHLRHEVEFGLRSILLKLRQGYLAVHGNSKELRALLTDSISGILVLFRHSVPLLGEIRPAKKIDSLGILSEKAGLKHEVFKNVYDIKQGSKETLKLDPDKLIDEYMEGIEKIVKVIDNLE